MEIQEAVPGVIQVTYKPLPAWRVFCARLVFFRWLFVVAGVAVVFVVSWKLFAAYQQDALDSTTYWAAFRIFLLAGMAFLPAFIVGYINVKLNKRDESEMTVSLQPEGILVRDSLAESWLQWALFSYSHERSHEFIINSSMLSEPILFPKECLTAQEVNTVRNYLRKHVRVVKLRKPQTDTSNDSPCPVSGGPSAQIRIAGLPTGQHISTPAPANARLCPFNPRQLYYNNAVRLLKLLCIMNLFLFCFSIFVDSLLSGQVPAPNLEYLRVRFASVWPVMGMFSLFIYIRPFVLLKKAMPQWQNITMGFTPQGLYKKTSRFESWIQWEYFSRWKESHDFFALRRHALSATVLIPKAALDEETQTLVRECCKRKVSRQ